jgi:hypothetical protein
MTLPKSLVVIADFVIKVIVAVVAFLTLGGAAIALNFFNSFAQSRNLLPVYIAYGMTGLEYAIFAVDTICFGYFLVIETLRFLRDITALLR